MAGRISEVLIKEGDYVRDGQLLVRLDDATQRHHVQALQGELQFAQARLERLNGAHEQERAEARAVYAGHLVKLKHSQQELKALLTRLVTKSAVGEQELDRWKADVGCIDGGIERGPGRLDRLLGPLGRTSCEPPKPR